MQLAPASFPGVKTRAPEFCHSPPLRTDVKNGWSCTFSPHTPSWLGEGLILRLLFFVVCNMREDRGVHRVLVGKPEGKRPMGRPRRRWEDNIKTDLQEVGGGRGDWMELAQDRDGWRALVGTVRDFRVP